MRPRGRRSPSPALTQAQAQLKPFPGLSVNNNWPLLFVASMAGDDGRRHGDHAVPDVPIDHVPAAVLASSQIFLTYPTGVPGHTPGTIAFPPSLKPGEEYYVSALIGNAGNWGAGRSFQGVPPHMFVQGDALAFNTFIEPQRPAAVAQQPRSAEHQPAVRAVFPGQGELTDVAASASTSTRCSPASRLRWRRPA